MAPTAQIGSRAGSPAHQLHSVVTALWLPGERILVLNGGSQDLLFFDGTGEHVRTVGGEGRGPSEFHRMTGAMLVGDSIWVMDGSLQRISIFDLEGNHTRTMTLDPTGDPSRPLRLYRLGGSLNDSTLLMLSAAWGANTFVDDEPLVYWDANPNLIYSRAGKLLGSSGPPSGMEMVAMPAVAGLAPSSGDRPFGRVSAAAVWNESLVIGDGQTYEIEVYSSGGTLERIIRRFNTPLQVTRKGWERLYEQRLGILPEQERPLYRRYFAAMPLPDREPAHGHQMVVSEEGHLWVERYLHPWEAPSTERRWDIFDRNGRWLGAVTTPFRLRIFAVRRERLLASFTDELGVEYVGVFSLDRVR